MTQHSASVAKAFALSAVLLVSACVGNPTASWNVDPAVALVPIGEEALSLTAPGLPDVSTRRARYLDNYQEEEYVLYQGIDGAQAELIMIEASSYGYGAQSGDRHVLDFPMITRDTLGTWNISKTANLGSAKSFPYEGRLPFYLLPFERVISGQNCFAFHSEFNRDPRDPQGGNFDNQLFGYYCAPHGTKLSREAMVSVIDRLDVIGVTKAAGLSYDKGAFQQLTNDADLLAMIQQGSPKGETGNPAFPFDVVRIYDDNGGGSDVP